MTYRKEIFVIAYLLAFVFLATVCSRVSFSAPQEAAASPTPTPSPLPEQIKIYTEEVMLPVVATDSNGRFDPTVSAEDLLVLEDGQAQEIRSIRRVPASVLLLLDTAGFNNPGMKTNATREFAMRLVSKLRPGDQVAAIEFGGKVELIQSWTSEREAAALTLKQKLFSGRGGHLSAALSAAAAQLKDAPTGNRHVVLVTDGGAAPAAGDDLVKGIEQLFATQATIHVVSYTSWGRKAISAAHPTVPVKITREKPKSANDIANDIMHPNSQETIERKNKSLVYLVLDLDYPLWRHNRDQLKTLQQNEPLLKSLAAETGGPMELPLSEQELPTICDNMVREIDAQYVVTYTPKAPVAQRAKGDLRRIEVVSRRVGLVVHSRRSYVKDAAPE